MTETTGALLDAAEVAYAERGVDAASLRGIMRDAGANPAAVHYHFGSREALARATLDRVLGPIQQRRIQLLEELTAHVSEPTVEQLLEALISPDFEAVVALGHRNPAAVRLLGTVYSRPAQLVKRVVEEHFAPVAVRYSPHFARALPDLSREELSWRVRWCVFGLLGALVSDDELSPATANDLLLSRAITALAGALRAPLAPGGDE